MGGSSGAGLCLQRSVGSLEKGAILQFLFSLLYTTLFSFSILFVHVYDNYLIFVVHCFSVLLSVELFVVGYFFFLAGVVADNGSLVAL